MLVEYVVLDMSDTMIVERIHKFHLYSESSAYVSQIEKLHYSEKFYKNKILNLVTMYLFILTILKKLIVGKFQGETYFFLPCVSFLLRNLPVSARYDSTVL